MKRVKDSKTPDLRIYPNQRQIKKLHHIYIQKDIFKITSSAFDQILVKYILKKGVN